MNHKEQPDLASYKKRHSLHIAPFPEDLQREAKIAAMRMDINFYEWIVQAVEEKINREM